MITTSNKKQVTYIQGDVILRRIEALPEGLTEMQQADETKERIKVLQQSEVTGHHHHFAASSDVDMFTSARDVKALSSLDFTTITPNEGKYIRVNRDANLFHGKGFDLTPYAKGSGDHNALQLPEGIYEIDIVREYDYERREVKRVVD